MTRRSTKATNLRDAKTVVESWRSQETKRTTDPVAAEKEETERRATARTFWQACKEWLATKDGVVSDKYFEVLEQRADAFWKAKLGSKSLGSIDAGVLRAYLKKRKTGTLDPTNKEPRPVSVTTVNDDLKALRLFFKFCIRSGWLMKNPATEVDPLRGTPKRKGRYLTPEEEARLLRACSVSDPQTVKAKRNTGGRAGGSSTTKKKSFKQRAHVPPYLAPLVRVGLYTGFRRRTLLSLEWRHIDLKERRWRVPAEIVKTSEDLDIPALDEAVEALVEHREKLGKDDDATKRLRPKSLIFGLDPDSDIKRSFRSAVKRAKLDGLSFHDLRRSFTNMLRRRGVPIDVAMALSGHRNLEVLMQSYRDVGFDEARKALDGIDSRSKAGT